MKKQDLERLVSLGTFHTFKTSPDGRVWVECVVCRRIPSLDGHAKTCLKAVFDAEQRRKAQGAG